MDRMVEAEIGGRKCRFNYSIDVMFDAVDKFGSSDELLRKMQSEGRESYEPTVWAAVRMSEDAALARKDAGYDPEPALSEDELKRRMSPYDYMQLKRAVVDAILAGMTREEKSDDEAVDEGLEELERKKEEAGV